MPTPRQYASNADRQRAFRQRMQEARRTALVTNAPPPPAIPTMPGTARWKALHAQAQAAMQTMLDEMQAYHADRSETWQEGEKGEAFETMMNDAEQILDSLDNFLP
jgi:hypothetical protein